MRVRDASLIARLGSERALKRRHLGDISTQQIGHMGCMPRVVPPKWVLSPGTKVWV